MIVVSDPTFNIDEKLSAGWFIGESDNDATLNFSQILGLICKSLKISFNGITFWGPSAGGFIGIQLSKYFPGSSAVAINAQTDIHKFDGHQLLYQKGFPGQSDERINAIYGERLRLIENIDKLAKNRIFIAQNKTDTAHYENHFKPFIKELPNQDYDGLEEGIYHKKNSSFTFWLYSHPNGHGPETEEMTHLIIQKLKLQKRFESF